MAPERLARPDEAFHGAHIAGLIAALEAATGTGALHAAKTLLIATVGAGITVAFALYRNEA